MESGETESAETGERRNFLLCKKCFLSCNEDSQQGSGYQRILLPGVNVISLVYICINTMVLASESDSKPKISTSGWLQSFKMSSEGLFPVFQPENYILDNTMTNIRKE